MQSIIDSNLTYVYNSSELFAESFNKAQAEKLNPIEIIDGIDVDKIFNFLKLKEK